MTTTTDPWELDDAIRAVLRRHLPAQVLEETEHLLNDRDRRDTARLLRGLKAHCPLLAPMLDALTDHVMGSGGEYPDCCAAWWQTADQVRPSLASTED